MHCILSINPLNRIVLLEVEKNRLYPRIPVNNVQSQKLWNRTAVWLGNTSNYAKSGNVYCSETKRQRNEITCDVCAWADGRSIEWVRKRRGPLQPTVATAGHLSVPCGWPSTRNRDERATRGQSIRGVLHGRPDRQKGFLLRAE